MAEQKEELIGSLKECAVAMAIFNLHPDVNVKLTNLQHLNKAYGSLKHKVENKQIPVTELDAVLEEVKKAITDAVDNIELKPEVKERVSRVAPNTLGQIIDNLKKNNIVEITAKVVFKQEEKPNVD